MLAMRWTSPAPGETAAAARRLAPLLPDEGMLVALCGPLGAGKTLFAKGLAHGLGIDPDQVASPTFVIANEWPLPARGRLVHADLYRLADVEELEAAGYFDWLAPGHVVIVEWADRFAEELPPDHLRIELRAGDSSETRELDVHGTGSRSEAVVTAWAAALGGSG